MASLKLAGPLRELDFAFVQVITVRHFPSSSRTPHRGNFLFTAHRFLHVFPQLRWVEERPTVYLAGDPESLSGGINQKGNGLLAFGENLMKKFSLTYYFGVVSGELRLMCVYLDLLRYFDNKTTRTSQHFLNSATLK